MKRSREATPALQPPAFASFDLINQRFTAMPLVRIVVSSKDQRASALVSRLQAQGMKVDAVMEAIGVVTGEVSNEQLPALASLPGITVEREGDVHLAPPDAPVQ